MNAVVWYAVSMIALFFAYTVCRSVFCRSLWVVFRRGNLGHLLDVQQIGGKVTVAQLSAILIYVAANGICMWIGVSGLSDLTNRSGRMASLNLIPLFLGGRTNTICNLLGMPLPTYYLTHHCIGLVVCWQGMLHAILICIGQVAAREQAVSGTFVRIDLTYMIGILTAPRL